LPKSNKAQSQLRNWLGHIPYLIIAAAAVTYVLVAETPFANTLTAASDGRIDLTTAWFYRFRAPDLLASMSIWNFTVPAFLFAVRAIGIKILWCALLTLEVWMARKFKASVRVLLLLLLLSGVALGEAAFLWALTIHVLALAIWLVKARGWRSWQAVVSFVGLVYVTLLTVSIASPLFFLHRQNVLSGKSWVSALRFQTRTHRVDMMENCDAAINPDDIHGFNAIESLSKRALRNFGKLHVIDLKVIDENYRLLAMRDAKGGTIFSDAARNFAQSEIDYARRIMPTLLKTASLCLIADFDPLPQAERPPFTRARKIFEARKTVGLNTVIIQLPRQ
jgi:hypothetical protein